MEEEIEESKRSPDSSIEHWFTNIEETLQVSGLRWLLDDGQIPKTNPRVLYIEITSFKVQLTEPVEFSVVEEDRLGQKSNAHLTVLSTLDAGGGRLPGIIVYPLKGSIPQTIIKGHTRDFSIGKSETGKISPKIFEGYILNILLPNLRESKKLPAILFLKRDVDNVSCNLFKQAAKEGLTILGLYSVETIQTIKQVQSGLAENYKTSILYSYFRTIFPGFLTA